VELNEQLRERVEKIDQHECKIDDLLRQILSPAAAAESKTLLVETFQESVAAYNDVRLIRSQLAAMPVVEAASQMDEKLKKIRDGYGYSFFRWFETFGLDQKSEEEELEEDGYMFDHSWVLQDEVGTSYGDLTERRRRVGTLVVRDELPAHVLAHFSRVRDCFALGRYHAAIIYCRALLEAACGQAISSRGLPWVSGSLDNDSLSDMLSTLRHDVYSNLLDGAYSRRTVRTNSSTLQRQRSRARTNASRSFGILLRSWRTCSARELVRQDSQLEGRRTVVVSASRRI
jgi:hypothetical protein